MSLDNTINAAENMLLYNVSTSDIPDLTTDHNMEIGTTLYSIAIVTLIFNYGSIILFACLLRKYKHRKVRAFTHIHAICIDELHFFIANYNVIHAPFIIESMCSFHSFLLI